MAILIDIIAGGAVNASGSVLSNGTAYIYSVGTTTLANIYTDKALTIPASNPVTLSSGGKAEVYADEEVRVVLFDSLGNQVDDIESLGQHIKITNISGDLEIDASAASRAAYFDENKKLTVSPVTSTELEYLSGVDSFLQRYNRPHFKASPSDSTQIIVPATSVQKAIVRINGNYYTNTSDKTLDVNTAGRNGLDTGTVAADTAYYLYAIPATTGTGFDLVCSVTAPSTGPTGFTYWSYLGAFPTKSSAATVEQFQSADGILMSDTDFENFSHNGDTLATLKTFSTMPTTARKAYFLLRFSSSGGGGAGQTGRITGGNSTSNLNLVAFSEVAGVVCNVIGWVPIFTPKTVYLTTSNASGTITAHLCGWQESPWEWP